MIRHFDLVIVGGSFAGLACARTAALRGLKVAVVDSKPEPGARVRTTGIVVKEASDDFDLPARLMRKVRGVRLYAPNDRLLDLSAPGYFFQATDTPGVLRWMAGEAERAGAALFYDRKFESGVEHARGVALASLGLHASFLVGADGARSRVAEHFGLSRNTQFLAGLEIDVPQLTLLAGIIALALLKSHPKSKANAVSMHVRACDASQTSVHSTASSIRHNGKPSSETLARSYSSFRAIQKIGTIHGNSGGIWGIPVNRSGERITTRCASRAADRAPAHSRIGGIMRWKWGVRYATFNS